MPPTLFSSTANAREEFFRGEREERAKKKIGGDSSCRVDESGREEKQVENGRQGRDKGVKEK